MRLSGVNWAWRTPGDNDCLAGQNCLFVEKLWPTSEAHPLMGCAR